MAPLISSLRQLHYGALRRRLEQEPSTPSDLSVARRKAFELEELKTTEWHLLEVGEKALAHEKYAAAKQMAESRGVDYVPSDVLLRRLFAGTAAQPTPPEVADAILSGVEAALSPLCFILQEFIELTKIKHLRMSDRQKHLWRLPRERAVANIEKALPG